METLKLIVNTYLWIYRFAGSILILFYFIKYGLSFRKFREGWWSIKTFYLSNTFPEIKRWVIGYIWVAVSWAVTTLIFWILSDLLLPFLEGFWWEIDHEFITKAYPNFAELSDKISLYTLIVLICAFSLITFSLKSKKLRKIIFIFLILWLIFITILAIKYASIG